MKKLTSLIIALAVALSFSLVPVAMAEQVDDGAAVVVNVIVPPMEFNLAEELIEFTVNPGDADLKYYDLNMLASYLGSYSTLAVYANAYSPTNDPEWNDFINANGMGFNILEGSDPGWIVAGSYLNNPTTPVSNADLKLAALECPVTDSVGLGRMMFITSKLNTVNAGKYGAFNGGVDMLAIIE